MTPLRILAILALASTASAHHRQTPAIVQITSTGDADLSRLPPRARIVLGLDTPSGRQIFRRARDGTLNSLTPSGDSANPTSSSTAGVVAWDSNGDLLAGNAPGRQVYLLTRAGLSLPALDPTGTSIDPALDAHGRRLAFSSHGDLAQAGNLGALQVFMSAGGAIVQVSRGGGTSLHSSFDRRGQVLAFDSTSDPVTGADTGVAQIWTAVGGAAAAPLTAGLGSSRLPVVSPRGRFIAFQSTANLAGDGTDTGVPQIYVYDRTSLNFARVTSELGGCVNPTVDERPGDWRIVFTCGAQGYLHLLRADQRYQLPVAGGDVRHAQAAVGNFFVLVSTTADPLHGGVTAGHQIYQLNLFKLAATTVAGNAVWFPDAAFRP